ncbi:MAG: hypothetical protein ACXWM7_04995 [Parachlamydiaceae bacterium]
MHNLPKLKKNCTHKEERLDAFLINPIPSPDTIASHLKTIESLKTFGIPKS